MNGALSLGIERRIESRECDECARRYTLVQGYIYRGEGAYAIYYTQLHDHEGSEAWIDVIFGSLDLAEAEDRVTFGCHLRRSPENGETSAGLVPAADVFSNSALFGRKLDREQALAHPWIEDFWAVVDFLVLEEPDIQAHMGA